MNNGVGSVNSYSYLPTGNDANDNDFPYIVGRKLFISDLFPSIAKVKPRVFWDTLALFLKTNCVWDTLYLGPGETISKEILEAIAQLQVELPPAELVSLQHKINLENLKKLTQISPHPMHIACYLGSIVLMEKAFTNKQDLNIRGTREQGFLKGFTPLSITLSLNHFEAFKWLLKQGASFKRLSHPFSKLEHLYKTRKPFVQLLIEYGLLKYQIQSHIGYSSLHWAALKGKNSFLLFLIQSGASVDEPDALKQTPLFHAIRGRKLETVELLIRLAANVNAKAWQGQTVLCESLNVGFIEGVALLLKKGATFSSTIFIKALQTHNPLLVKTFVRYAQRMEKSEVFLFLNSRYRNKLSLFIPQAKFDINIYDSAGTPLFNHVAQKGTLSLINAFLSCSRLNKECCDVHKVSALHIAVCKGDIFLARMLLDNGFDVNAATSLRITALHIAAQSGNTKMVALLLKYKADVNSQDYAGLLPFHRAALSNCDCEEMFHLMSHANLFLNPYLVYILYKQGRFPFIKQLYDQLETKIKSEEKEICQRLLLSHIFKVDGYSELIPIKHPTNISYLSMEGMTFDNWLYRKIIKQVENLYNLHESDNNKNNISNHETPPIFPAPLLTLLQNLCLFSEKKDESAEYLVRIWSKEPTLIYSGWSEHAVQFFVWDDIFVINNLHNHLIVRRFQPTKLTSGLITEIRRAKAYSSANYYDLLIKLSCILEFKEDQSTKEMEQAYDLPVQEVGNCVYASLESGIWSFIYLYFLFLYKVQKIAESETKKLFELLILKLKLAFTIKYLDYHLQNEKDNYYYPDLSLCEIAVRQVISYNIKRAHPYYCFYADTLIKFEKLKKYRALTVYFYKHVAILKRELPTPGYQIRFTFDELYKKYN